LFGNVVADISGSNNDPSHMKVNNFNKGLMDQLDIAFKPSDNNTKLHKKFAEVEVNTVRDLHLRLARCDNKSMREIFRSMAHRQQTQAGHSSGSQGHRSRHCGGDADKVWVLMERWPLFVT
jgi:hypothetical protein